MFNIPSVLSAELNGLPSSLVVLLTIYVTDENEIIRIDPESNQDLMVVCLMLFLAELVTIPQC